MIPIAARNPAAGRQLGGELRNALAELGLRLGVPQLHTCKIAPGPPKKCTCASLNPGSSSLPPRSISSVRGPTHLRISAFDPTATMRLPRHATASARGCASFTVQTLPFTSARVAGIARPRDASWQRKATPQAPLSGSEHLNTDCIHHQHRWYANLLPIGSSRRFHSSHPPTRCRVSGSASAAATASCPEYRHARFGMEFRALDADQPIYRFNEQHPAVAASTTMLLTEGQRAGAARRGLQVPAPDARLPHRAHRRGFGTLNGDLILVSLQAIRTCRTASSPMGRWRFKTWITHTTRCLAVRTWYPAIRWRSSAS